MSARSIARRFTPVAQTRVCETPHPALRATFSRKGRRQVGVRLGNCDTPVLLNGGTNDA
jgi:hypothetical protein